MKKASSDLSILGFGCMRLPVGEDGRIDEQHAARMLRYAIDSGVNYVDTAYPYHNGESEPFLGRALQGGYREKVNLATKLPSWLIKSRRDMDRYLDEQLRRLQTDHIDFYLLHGLARPYWDKLRPLGVAEFLDDALADGRIKHAGFSFHDELHIFKEIVDFYDWTFCQIQYNFMDEHYQAGTEGLKYAAGKGLGVVVMEPLRGGMLSREIPAVSKVWERSTVKRNLSEWALRWVWSHTEVTVVLSGMSNFQQTAENVALALKEVPCPLPGEELSLYEQARAEYQKRIKVPCTGCRYCMPCPSGVSIPECFEMYNNACMFDSQQVAGLNYNMAMGGFPDGKPSFASLCQECGECRERCPQKIDVPERLKEVAAYFGR